MRTNNKLEKLIDGNWIQTNETVKECLDKYNYSKQLDYLFSGYTYYMFGNKYRFDPDDNHIVTVENPEFYRIKTKK